MMRYQFEKKKTKCNICIEILLVFFYLICQESVKVFWYYGPNDAILVVTLTSVT